MGGQRIWINGVEGESGLLPDEGVFFGRGVFETIRIGATPWFLEAHMGRLSQGAESIGIVCPFGAADVEAFFSQHTITDCAVRITLTPRNWIVSTRPLPYDTEKLLTGLRVCIGETRRNAKGRIAHVKSTCYLESLLEREIASKRGFQEAILLNTDGVLAEGCASNLFFVKADRVYTPADDCGLLPGILREWVLQTLRSSQEEPVCQPSIQDSFYPMTSVQCGYYTIEDLLTADEVFLTNSLMGIAGVRELMYDGETMNWEPGPVTRMLKSHYEKADKSAAVK